MRSSPPFPTVSPPLPHSLQLRSTLDGVAGTGTQLAAAVQRADECSVAAQDAHRASEVHRRMCESLTRELRRVTAAVEAAEARNSEQQAEIDALRSEMAERDFAAATGRSATEVEDSSFTQRSGYGDDVPSAPEGGSVHPHSLYSVASAAAHLSTRERRRSLDAAGAAVAAAAAAASDGAGHQSVGRAMIALQLSPPTTTGVPGRQLGAQDIVEQPQTIRSYGSPRAGGDTPTGSGRYGLSMQRQRGSETASIAPPGAVARGKAGIGTAARTMVESSLRAIERGQSTARARPMDSVARAAAAAAGGGRSSRSSGGGPVGR